MALPRLKRRREFLRAAKSGKRAARPGVTVQALPGTDGPLRVGFTATKKLGNAVVRNRTKRRLRAAARLLLAESPPPGWDLVLIGREGTAGRDFATLLGDLRGALRQAGVPVPGGPGPGSPVPGTPERASRRAPAAAGEAPAGVPVPEGAAP